MRRLVLISAVMLVTSAAAEIVIRSPLRLSTAEQDVLMGVARTKGGKDLAVVQITAWDGKTKSAIVVFEPYAWNEQTFQLDFVECERSFRAPWHCDKLWTGPYMHDGTISGSVRLDGDIDLDLAHELVEYSRSSSCPVQRASGVLNFYNLRDSYLASNSDGTYTLGSGGCVLQMTVQDSKVVSAVKRFVLE